MNAVPMQVHNAEVPDVFPLLHSRPEGLTDVEAQTRLREAGPNRLERERRFQWAKSLGRHFINFFSILLDVSAAACFVANSLQPGQGMAVLGWALLGVAVLNALFAFAQEWRAERAMQELRKFLPQRVRVRRNGSDGEIVSEELVPGDVLLLGEGDRIPGDGRLVEATDLLVNNAPLTGESRSQPLSSAPARGDLSESPNIVFAGCSVLRGSGTAVVFATGHRTEFGKIASLSRDIRRPLTPLARETTRMIRILTVIAVTMGLLFFGYGIATGRSLWINIVFMLGIIVANVPEGLLPTLTLALSMASLRMARKQVLVKGLEAIEALGTVHVICTDKTGTLTCNELALSGVVDSVSGEPISDALRMRALLKAAVIASEVRQVNGRRTGDPLDILVIERYAEAVGAPDAILAGTRRHFPFDMEKRREAGLFADGDEVLFAIKGAWESLRPLIRSIDQPEGAGTLPANPQTLAACDSTVERLSGQGQRVIAVASCLLSAVPNPAATEESLEQRLVLHGLLTLDDPLRPEVPEAVARCRGAGIRVIMITGDHPRTAQAVARRCGILADGEQQVLRGDELQRMQQRELAERLQQGVAVFARTTPEQKSKIVMALRRLGCVVAMTGDGVNDAPALKAADVGMAMGLGGTDVAREAADLVLLDNNFASIVAGVEEGRAVYANIQKFTTYVLASNIPEIVPYLLFIVLPLPLALTVIQILSIDLGTDLLPAIGLGQEPPEPDTMSRPPRRSNERLLSFSVMATAYLFLGMIQAGYSLFLFFLVLVQGGWHWGQDLATTDPLYRSATGITLASVVLMQIGNVIGRRSQCFSALNRGLLANKLILAGIATEVIFSWAILYAEPVQRILGTGPVTWQVYALAWLGIPLLYLADLVRKRFITGG